MFAGIGEAPEAFVIDDITIFHCKNLAAGESLNFYSIKSDRVYLARKIVVYQRHRQGLRCKHTRKTHAAANPIFFIHSDRQLSLWIDFAKHDINNSIDGILLIFITNDYCLRFFLKIEHI